MKLIDKDALVAEIEKRRRDWCYGSSIEAKYKREECDDILSFLDNLEIKEVDLEKEVDDWYNTKASKEFENVLYSDIENCAKHFFELGLNASNPLTWEDMMTIHKFIKDAMNLHLYEWSTIDGQQKIYEDILKRFKDLKK